MDFQRYILIAAIAAVMYLLLQEWTDFKSQAPVAEPTPVVEQQYPGDLPAAESKAQPTATNTDIPAPEPSSVDTVTPPESSTSAQLIEVETPTLRVQIDLLGGSIVDVKLLKHLTGLDSNPQPFQLLENSSRRLYIAQSGLIGVNGTDKKGRPLFSADKQRYELKNEDKLMVDLHLPEKDGVTIIKRFTFVPDDYTIKMEYLINNQSGQDWQAALYGQIKRDDSPDPSAESRGFMQIRPFLGAATTTPEDRFVKFKFKAIEEEKFKVKETGGWIAMIQHYFLSAWIPAKDTTNTYATTQGRDGNYIARFTGDTVLIPAGENGSISAQFYAGPKDQYRLRELAEGLDLSVDYGWLWWICQPLFWLLTFLHSIVGNWGFSIILLTVIVKLAFFYPSAIAYKSMAKMRQVTPKMQAIRERHPEDRQAQSQEMMALYKKEGVNPLGGCLPILIQMPVFISLYWVLMESVELRHAPFIGYIKDLSSMDPYFILPLLMGASMFFQQKLNPPPPDPMQAKVLQWMPVIFTFFFLWFPSGLVLYWVVNNLLSIAQQWVISKQVEAASSGAAN